MISAVNKLKRSKAPILINGLSCPVFRGVSVKHLMFEESTLFILLNSTWGFRMTGITVLFMAGYEYTDFS
jgi:hypothetical protein